MKVTVNINGLRYDGSLINKGEVVEMDSKVAAPLIFKKYVSVYEEAIMCAKVRKAVEPKPKRRTRKVEN